MKRLLFLLLPILLFSCEMVIFNDYDRDPLANLPTVSSIYEAWEITSNIEYDGGSVRCKSPNETYTTNSGDCEDICGLFMALLNPLGYNTRLVGVDLYSGAGKHAVVWVEGYGYCEPQDYLYQYDSCPGETFLILTLEEYLGYLGTSRDLIASEEVRHE